MASELVALVIHHRRYPVVLRTVDHLLQQNLAPDRVLLVDNSEDALIAQQLTNALPAGVGLLVTANRGYAAAVNDGLEFSGWLDGNRLVAVLTHEVTLHSGCLSHLVEAIESAPDIGVAGPTLHDARTGSPTLWSQGGRRGRLTGVPHHVRSNRLAVRPPHAVTDREWLDGAMTVYRSGALRDHPLDESFFLYLEETDCHLRLRQAGWRVVWVPPAVAAQEPGGMPAYLHGRNLTRLLRHHGPAATWPLGLASAGVRVALRELAGRAERGSLRRFAAGARSELTQGEAPDSAELRNAVWPLETVPHQRSGGR